MIHVAPVTLDDGVVRLEPLDLGHVDGLARAAADGALWTLRVTSVPEPHDTPGYVERALAMQAEGHRLPFAVLDAATREVIGCTSYHDIVASADRVEIGWTWYAKRRQQTDVNARAKLLLMRHAFETLGARVVGWRTDNFNFASQRAIERLGARRDGVIRHHALRRDGTVRDTVMYSMTLDEWPGAKAELEARIRQRRA